MLTIGQIMTKDVISIGIKTPVFEAIRILVEKEISGLPVVDENKKLLGIITEKDLLKMLFEEAITDQQVVGEHMSKNVVTFAPEESVLRICEFLMDNPFRRVPIVSEGRLVGIVSRRDILKIILKKK